MDFVTMTTHTVTTKTLLPWNQEAIKRIVVKELLSQWRTILGGGYVRDYECCGHGTRGTIHLKRAYLVASIGLPGVHRWMLKRLNQIKVGLTDKFLVWILNGSVKITLLHRHVIIRFCLTWKLEETYFIRSRTQKGSGRAKRYV